jgi:acetyl esterase
MITPTPSSDSPTCEVLAYKSTNRGSLFLKVIKPAAWSAHDRRPALVIFHGGGWTGGAVSQFEPQARHFAARGIVSLLVQYRLLADEKAPPDPCIADAKSAMRWVRSRSMELGIDPSRIAAMGGSAGGHLAAAVTLLQDLDDPGEDLTVNACGNALILFNPVLDNGPGEWGSCRVGDRYPQLSPAHNVRKDSPPTILFLGTADNLVPVTTLERFRDRLLAVGAHVELHLYPNQGHGFFNFDRADKSAYKLTLAATERFLSLLGWIGDHGVSGATSRS